MSNLKSLTFTILPAPFIKSAKFARRERLIDRLEEQRHLAKDPSFIPVVKRWKKTPDGSKALVDHPRRLKPWWKADEKGFVVLTVRSGFKTLEFEKGKAAIAVGAVDRLDGVLTTLIAAARAGELDGLLEAVSGSSDGGVLKGGLKRGRTQPLDNN